jgi:predicted nucleic acid-binding protein
VVVVDTSAWVEYFRDGDPAVVAKVDRCLEEDLVAIGDLVLCEVMQGIASPRARAEVSALFRALPHLEMVGFGIAERAAENYRRLRAAGITVRKTIDVLIGTFCAENGLRLVHHDSDFTHMAARIGLKTL